MQLVSKTTVEPTAPTTETITLDVGGMKCAGCVKVVEKQLTQHPDVISACVNLVQEVAVVECEQGIDPDALAQKLTAAGFTAQPRYSQEDIATRETDLVATAITTPRK
jgi:Cu2+-exporting ATPase